MLRPRPALRMLAAPFLLAALAGCGRTDRIVASSVPLDDYHARHPIVLAQARDSIDVFPTRAGRLDTHTAKQIYAFALQYRELGQGRVVILLPRNHDARAAVGEIKRVLDAGGVRAAIDIATYPVADPALAAPVRISFDGLRAKVADQCGQWPRDLASASSVEGWENKPYWNFGCATQTMIAAQTADPRDLVTPRGEEPADTLMRSRGIDSVRRGSDPNTAWAVRSSQIGGAGGQ